MATQSTPLTDAAWTPKVALLTDEIANEVYASHYAERKTSRYVIGTLSVLLLGSFGAIVSLAHKPIVNRYIRIDEMGRAQAIQYSDLNYSPREGEVRTYITDWANNDARTEGMSYGMMICVQLNKKLSYPLITLIMAVLAIPFSLSTGKKGAITGVAVAVGIAVFYTVVSRLFEAMGDLSQLPPALAAWSPDLIFVLVGGYLILKVPT